MRWFRTRGVVLIAVAASSWPLHILTVNLFGIVRPERVIAIIGLVWAAGMLLVGLLTILGVDPEPAENMSFVAVVFVMNGGPILREFGPVAYLVLIACPLVAGWLFVRFRSHFVVAALVWGTAVTLAVGPVITFFESWGTRGGQSTVAYSESLSVEMSDKPDIFLVVFDGYPGSIAAAQDGLDIGQVDVVSELQNRGFQVPASSWSSYWLTSLSIPSLLEMNYPVVDGASLDGETGEDLHRILSGASVTVQSVKANGYQTHMIESGWSAAACGSAIDHCVPSPLLDEATYLVLKHTVAWSVIDDSPGPYVLGTLAGFDWLFEHAPDLSASATPDFVFMHVVSPHPPLLLAEDCSVDFRYERMGTVFHASGVPTETREQYLVDQIDCLDTMMVRLAESVEPDDVVVFVSDHGTDRRGQADPDKVDWDRAATVERLNNFLALRVPDGCEVEDSVAVPNVLRAVLDCLSPATVERLPERMWVNPMVELDEKLVDELLGMRAEAGGPGVDLSQPTGTIP